MKNPVVKTLIIIVMLIAFGAGLGIYSSSYYQAKSNLTTTIPGLLWPNPKTLRPFASIDQNGNVFGLEQLTGKWSFVFFGYTNCPDVCPISMNVMSQVDKILRVDNPDMKTQMVFMTVDPERDTTEQLKQYVSYFSPSFIGLGGTKQQVDSLARQIGIAYGKSDIESETKYLVDHTASIFLIDPNGRFIGVFSSPHEAQDIADRFKQIKKFMQQQS